MRTRRAPLFALVFLLVASPACVGRAIDEGVGLATGPKGYFMQLQPIDGLLDEYQGFDIDRFADETGGRLPDNFQDEFERAFQDELSGRRLPMHPDRTPRLRIRGTVIHVETKDLKGLILGDFEEILLRAELLDARGRVVGRANLIGRSDESVNRGVGKKAQGAARALAAWIDQHYEANGEGTVRESLEAKEIGKREGA